MLAWILSQAGPPSTNPPQPSDVNNTFETFLSLGLGGFLLSGFVAVLLAAIVIILTTAWSRRRNSSNPSM